jgi:hypothetical protein
MKKVFLALGLFAFILAGVVAVDTAVASDTDNVVYDDPPKADKKKSSDCADYSKSSCCSSKTATASKSDCSDTKSTSTVKAKTTTTKATTASNTTKKSSPDKK